MNLEQAVVAIENYMSRMDGVYGGAVFDETILVSFKEAKPEILNYRGPREVTVGGEFFEDLVGLKADLKNPQLGPGDFEFTREGAGKAFDAFLVLGKGYFLICNSTGQSTLEITANPAWRQAQRAFFDLGEAFRADPLQ